MERKCLVGILRSIWVLGVQLLIVAVHKALLPDCIGIRHVHIHGLRRKIELVKMMRELGYER
jgi:hypothetical protein